MGDGIATVLVVLVADPVVVVAVDDELLLLLVTTVLAVDVVGITLPLPLGAGVGVPVVQLTVTVLIVSFVDGGSCFHDTILVARIKGAVICSDIGDRWVPCRQVSGDIELPED